MLIKISSPIQLGLSLVFNCTMFSSLMIAETMPSKTNSYPAGFSEQYLQECQKQFASKGISSEDSLKYCNCTINKIQETYSFEELNQINNDMEKTNRVPTGLNEVINYCSKAVK